MWHFQYCAPRFQLSTSLPSSVLSDIMVWLEIGHGKYIYTTECYQLRIFLYRELSVTNIPLAVITNQGHLMKIWLDQGAGKDLRN